MKSLEEIKKSPDVMVKESGIDGGMGYVRLTSKTYAVAVWSNGGGWDHVSVSFKNRCPSWDEMCKVKDIFFNEDECCVEYHPKKKDYINVYPYCLHIWKPQHVEIPTPPKFFV